ncbi:Colicin V secretion protein CvaA [Halomonadaceae bacterium LMG 33818]|uniref:HlyD family secretion protein n=1 Tax=Cernens ardua TaxID=3402176 RepID=UPI003EDB85B9
MFRQAAIENRKRRWQGRAIMLPGLSPWLIGISCSLFMLILVIFIVFGSYTRRADVSGEVTTWPRATNIVSGVQGVIDKQYVQQGQNVQAGDPVFSIDVSKSTTAGNVSVSERRDIEDQISRINDIITHLKNSKAATLASLTAQKEQYQAALKKSTQIVKNAEQGIAIMRNNMNDYRAYLKRGLITKYELINQEATYYDQQNQLQTLTAQNQQNQLQITSLESEIQTQSADFDNRIYQMEIQRFDLNRNLTNTDLNGEVVIRALSDGKIDSLNVSPGQMVNSGDSLFQILPQHVDHYYLVLWVPNEQIPYIHTGDRVNLRYEAFPYQRFGQFGSTVSYISRAPASTQEMASYPGAPTPQQAASTPYYRVLIRPDHDSVFYNGQAMPLENGMKASATLFLEKRRIYQWMLSPFYDMKRSATGPIQ